MRALTVLLAIGSAACVDHDYFGPTPQLVLDGSASADIAVAVDDVDLVVEVGRGKFLVYGSRDRR